MDKSELESFVLGKLGNDTTGHDFHHCMRVAKVAEKLALSEPECNRDVVVAAALLHDIPDPKITTDIEGAYREISALLEEIALKQDKIAHVLYIIRNLSFKGAGVDTSMSTIEGKLVQDADRLDAIGAIGIARCFAYGGSKGRQIFNPDEQPCFHSDETSYRSSTSSSFNHFFEKLILLKDRMQTTAGIRVAEQRHAYLCQFMEQFQKEWDGNDIN